MKTVEYRVIPVERYAITRYVSESRGDGRMCSGSSQKLGEFDNAGFAVDVAQALSGVDDGSRVDLRDLHVKLDEDMRSKPAQWIIVLDSVGDVNTQAYYAYSEEEALQTRSRVQREGGGVWRIFSRPNDALPRD